MPSNKKHAQTALIIIAVLFVVVAGIFYVTHRNNTQTNFSLGGGESVVIEAQAGRESEAAAEVIVVHIAGEVKNPGVYEIQNGARVSDLVELAGGATNNADIDSVNLAARLTDAQKITIPPIGGAAFGGSGYINTDTTLININTASAAELKTLPGIGDVRAADIIAYREKNGAFSSIDEIVNVPGIGSGIFERISGLITH